MQSIFRSASRCEAPGKHLKRGRRDGGLKMDLWLLRLVLSRLIEVAHLLASGLDPGVEKYLEELKHR